ncbi:UvrD-helicase domain-containing protein [Anaerosinus gibii]|uniref:AAA family ATPase n=1 Tax=Selenobaculum gibii TaxID=3054208 RepID=A0A9Y2ETE4_9FIRM|nr:UvrD-helicase domain-containing protein [Selenobaculum gbiensis]WIW71476.1 AAA family ATPase [Selenobaculum gbiensis]
MVTEKLEKEVIEVFKLIDEKKNFVLSGGAGSGKTYSLVAVINEIYSRNPAAKIACITYTNAAVHEIENRVANNKLRISTIHDFLWDNISSFQSELKSTLIEGINNSEVKYKNIKVETPYINTFEGGIKYTEYLRLATGNISHDEVITLANQMFKKYPKLCDILNNKYDYILVDEYQDTFPKVVEILLDFLPSSKTTTKGIIGFFGDSMQSIYDDGIGDLNKYIESSFVVEIQKKQNRRNPQSVITLSNKLRTDGLKQEPSKDGKAPNMENDVIKQGSIKFLYGSIFLDELKNKDYFKGWNFDNPKETKELRLTHNLIAATAGFPILMEIYDKDPLLKLKGDFLAYIKKEGIEINEDQTFDAVMLSIDWRFSNKVRTVENRGRKQIEVFLENNENSILYDIIKNMAFSDVKRIYFDKDNLISDKKEIDEKASTQSKRDKLIRHLFKIQSVIKSYEDKEYNEFLRKTSFKIGNIADKRKIKQKLDTLVNMKENTIAEVISYADESGLCLKDDNINLFIKENEYLFKRVSGVKYDEFIHLYDYLEGFSPLSTQHKIKGAEFNNVLVILDNGKWNDYNFEYLFNPTHEKCNKNVLARTNKLFYVCCTRAMDNLVVYCENPSSPMIITAEDWFGKENCIPM